jgi:hypothetical protein
MELLLFCSSIEQKLCGKKFLDVSVFKPDIVLGSELPVNTNNDHFHMMTKVGSDTNFRRFYSIIFSIRTKTHTFWLNSVAASKLWTLVLRYRDSTGS